MEVMDKNKFPPVARTAFKPDLTKNLNKIRNVADDYFFRRKFRCDALGWKTAPVISMWKHQTSTPILPLLLFVNAWARARER
jgi:hypothetical protein